MSDQVVVIGGGPIGLATALLLAAEGREVTVFEKDRQAPPTGTDQGGDSWQRSGVPQFRQAHYFHPRFRQLLDADLPAVRDRLEELGGRRLNLLPALLQSLTNNASKPGDDRFDTLTARRPVVERAFAEVAEATAGVNVVRGVGVEAILTGPSLLPGVPHVNGVRTSTGTELEAGLVIDAMGRRSRLSDWVSQFGGEPPSEESTDAGFAYYTRHYGARRDVRWQPRGPLAMDIGTLRVLTLPGDNETWTIAIVAVAGDAPFKALRHNHAWERVARAVPTGGEMVDGEPLSDVIPMAGVMDRHRRIVVDGLPVATGIVPVGDSWACTNPTAGRGVSLGLAHAVAFRDALREQPDDLVKLVQLFDDVTEHALTPWYRDQIARDQQRAAQFKAVIEGRPAPPQPDPLLGLQLAARADADAARGVLDVLSCLALPQEVLSRPGMSKRVHAVLDGAAPSPPPHPTREELIALATA